MGGFSDERTLEKELGILFKKTYRMTNHHSDYNDQMASRTTLKQVQMTNHHSDRLQSSACYILVLLRGIFWFCCVPLLRAICVHILFLLRASAA
jgi:hypothetical protein